jgi:predicted helicase
MKLAETGYLFGGVVPEIKVFLTNALEPGEERAQLTLDPSGIALEGKLANRAKTEQRFSVILGNPPYANFGRMNRNPHILKLLATYKEGLGEKKLNLDDDFIKFIRQAEHTILTSGVGVCGMITNNTFMEAPTRRGMRARLMEDFQVIFVTDLHGNSIERETCPDGSPDDNVFEIQQGVAVSVLIRKSGITSQDSCIIHHRDFYGTREVKQRDLLVATVLSSSMTTLRPIAPQFAFQPSTFPHSREYLGFIPLAEVFNISGSGVKTDRDALCFDFDRDLLETRMKLAFSGHNDLDFVERFRIEDSSSFDLTRRLREGVFRKESIKPCLYRLFDERWLYYERGFTSRPAWDVMQHMLGDNRALLAKRQARDGDYSWVFVTKSLVVDGLFSIDNKGREQIIPLYIFDTGALTNGPRQGATRTNFAAGFLRLLKETFWTSADERWGLPIGISPENCFDYIYAILHSPTYRSRYYLGLKEDFPRIPLAASIETFQALSGLGSSLVAAHLLGDGLNPPVSIAYLGTPNPQIGACNWKDGAIWLETAAAGSSEDIAALRNRFVGVAESTWTFHIGGHQVCKKWLDDRRKAGRTLSADDITHYQKIIAAITETIRIMAEIDEVIDAQGGWPAAFLTTPVETP